MELQDYLSTYGLERLCLTYSIRHIRHKKYPHLVCLKYSQRDSPMAEKVVQQCRGIIFDESDNWRIVSYPYNKFFSYGEKHAAKLDWSTAWCYEKLDGSLMVLYFYDGHWHVQTSATPDARTRVDETQYTFINLFWQVWSELGYQLPDAKSTQYCFMFELLTPFNQVITKQRSNRLILHGLRDTATCLETSPELYEGTYEIAQRVKINNWQSVKVLTAELDPLQSEGFVVCDANFNRVKVKSPQYVALAHLEEGSDVLPTPP